MPEETNTETESDALELLEEIKAEVVEAEEEVLTTETEPEAITTDDEPKALWEELGLENEGELRDHFKKTAQLQDDYSALVKSVNEGKGTKDIESPASTDETDYDSYPFKPLSIEDEGEKNEVIHDFLYEMGERPLEVMAHVFGPSIRYYVQEYVKHTFGQRDFADTMSTEQTFVEQHMDKFQELTDSGLSDEKALNVLKKFFPGEAKVQKDPRAADRKGTQKTKGTGGSKRPAKNSSTFGEGEDADDKGFREQVMNDFLADNE